MYSPITYGRFAEEAGLTAYEQGRIEQFVRACSNQNQFSGLDSEARNMTLPSGKTVRYIKVGQISKVIVYPTPLDREEIFPKFAEVKIPMLISGNVTRYLVRKPSNDNPLGEGVSVRVTRDTRRRVAGYPNNERDWSPNNLALRRFRIENTVENERAGFVNMLIKDEATLFFSQYQYLYPSMYSGAMSSVAQIVQGYGMMKKINTDGMPEWVKNDRTLEYEEPYLRVPDAVAMAIQKELEVRGRQLPAYKGKVPIEGKCQYKFRPDENHGVGFAVDGKPWLITIKPSGVYAQPLPVVPETTTKAFRAYMEDVDDQEIITILEKFKGMPSNEPDFEEGWSDNDFDIWVRAGAIIRVCDSGAFYSNGGAPHDMCGWSFNSRGSSAFNTCYKTNEGQPPFFTAVMLNLTLGETREPYSREGVSQEETNTVSNYLSLILSRAAGDSSTNAAIRFKISMASHGELLSRARGTSNINAEYSYWDSLVADPIAIHTGSMKIISQGYVSAGINDFYVKWPQIQENGPFPMTGIADWGMDAKAYQKGDTIIYGAYIDDDLHVVKHFQDDDPFMRKSVGNLADAQRDLLGSWEGTTYTGAGALEGRLYTSKWDDREVTVPISSTGTITRADRGYGGISFSVPLPAEMIGSISRRRYYQENSDTESWAGVGVNNVLIAPLFARDCIFYVIKKTAASHTRTISQSGGSMSDHSYPLVIFDSVFHWHGYTEIDPQNPLDRGKNNGEKSYALPSPLPQFPNEGNFAYSGDWFGAADSVKDISDILAPIFERPAGSMVSGTYMQGSNPTIRSFSKTTRNESTVPDAQILFDAPHANDVVVGVTETYVRERYFLPSPLRDAIPPDYYWRSASWNCFGEAEICVVDIKDHMKTPELRYWGKCEILDYESVPHFIGVINR